MLAILQPGFCWLKIRLAVEESVAGTIVFCCTEFPLISRKAISYFFISQIKMPRVEISGENLGPKIWLIEYLVRSQDRFKLPEL